MENDPEIEFEHFLSQKLGMTVARMRAEMGNGEFIRWSVYYARRNQETELQMAKAKA